MSCGIGCRRNLDPTRLWLWCRPAAVALIQPLSWEPPCTTGVALKSQKKIKNKSEDDFDFKYQKTNLNQIKVGVETSLRILSILMRSKFCGVAQIC